MGISEQPGASFDEPSDSRSELYELTIKQFLTDPIGNLEQLKARLDLSDVVNDSEELLDGIERRLNQEEEDGIEYTSYLQLARVPQHDLLIFIFGEVYEAIRTVYAMDTTGEEPPEVSTAFERSVLSWLRTEIHRLMGKKIPPIVCSEEDIQMICLKQ